MRKPSKYKRTKRKPADTHRGYTPQNEAATQHMIKRLYKTLGIPEIQSPTTKKDR